MIKIFLLFSIKYYARHVMLFHEKMSCTVCTQEILGKRNLNKHVAKIHFGKFSEDTRVLPPPPSTDDDVIVKVEESPTESISSSPSFVEYPEQVVRDLLLPSSNGSSRDENFNFDELQDFKMEEYLNSTLSSVEPNAIVLPLNYNMNSWESLSLFGF